MREIFNFIYSHYEAILSVLTFVISVVILILRKKPVNNILVDINAYIFQGVLLAEKTDLKGNDKLNYAFNYVVDHLLADYPTLDISRYHKVILNGIELILSTPQKKEVK